MTAKEYLSQAWSIKTRLEVMADQLAFLKSTALYVTSQYSDMPKSGIRNIHKNEDAIVRILDYEEQMRKQYALLDEINETINSVSNATSQAILVKRYLGHNTWDEIVKTIYISRSHVFELHKAALIEIDKLILKRTVSHE